MAGDRPVKRAKAGLVPRTKSQLRAVELVTDLLDLMAELDGLTKREASATAELLHNGAAFGIYHKNALWEKRIGDDPVHPDAVDVFMALNNMLRFNKLGMPYVTFEDLAREFGS
jgi:hypothetical protein